MCWVFACLRSVLEAKISFLLVLFCFLFLMVLFFVFVQRMFEAFSKAQGDDDLFSKVVHRNFPEFSLGFLGF